MEAAVLRAIEEAVEALGRSDPALARSALGGVRGFTPALGAIFVAVGVAATELEVAGEVTPGTWDALADAVPSELRGLVEASRS
jgi:hypothetical protein